MRERGERDTTGDEPLARRCTQAQYPTLYAITHAHIAVCDIGGGAAGGGGAERDLLARGPAQPQIQPRLGSAQGLPAASGQRGDNQGLKLTSFVYHNR